jgi:hypothetical protein
LGRREAVKRRCYRWVEMAVLDEILAALAREADLEWLMIDSTIVRAHQHAARARRQKGGRTPRALVAPAEATEHQNPGRGRCAGKSMRLIGSPGQRNDIAFAHHGSKASLPASPWASSNSPLSLSGSNS